MANLTIVSTSVLAAVLTLSTRRVTELVALGVIERVGRGEFDLAQSVQRYADWRAAQASARHRPNAATRLQDRKAALIAVKIEREQRGLIPLVDALDEFDHVVESMLSSFERLPRLVTDDAGERARIEAVCEDTRAQLRKQIDEIRHSLQNGACP
ncbi:MAG: hypothetical protein JJ913_08075 [Rhizobiaceae bacterium]|nr:hypothetical protein [Rhizobiaceae bacterium]